MAPPNNTNRVGALASDDVDTVISLTQAPPSHVIRYLVTKDLCYCKHSLRHGFRTYRCKHRVLRDMLDVGQTFEEAMSAFATHLFNHVRPTEVHLRSELQILVMERAKTSPLRVVERLLGSSGLRIGRGPRGSIERSDAHRLRCKCLHATHSCIPPPLQIQPSHTPPLTNHSPPIPLSDTNHPVTHRCLVFKQDTSHRNPPSLPFPHTTCCSMHTVRQRRQRGSMKARRASIVEHLASSGGGDEEDDDDDKDDDIPLAQISHHRRITEAAQGAPPVSSSGGEAGEVEEAAEEEENWAARRKAMWSFRRANEAAHGSSGGGSGGSSAAAASSSASSARHNVVLSTAIPSKLGKQEKEHLKDLNDAVKTEGIRFSHLVRVSRGRMKSAVPQRNAAASSAASAAASSSMPKGQRRNLTKQAHKFRDRGASGKRAGAKRGASQVKQMRQREGSAASSSGGRGREQDSRTAAKLGKKRKKSKSRVIEAFGDADLAMGGTEGIGTMSMG